MDDQNKQDLVEETVPQDEVQEEVAQDTPVDEAPVENAPEEAVEEQEAAPQEVIVEDEYDTEVANVVENAEIEDDSDAPEATSISERGSGSKKLAGHIVISKTEDPKALWYVVHSSSGHEARVAESLRQRVETMKLEGKIFEVLIPTQDRV